MAGVSKAAKGLLELLKQGYPESVAKRIVSGDLPMDEVSRLARAAEQGYDVANPMFHGTNADIKAFDKNMRGSGTNAESARKAFWFTDDPYFTARSYADHSATTNRVTKLLSEADAAEKAGNWDLYDQKIREAEVLESSFMSNPDSRLAGQNLLKVLLPRTDTTIDARGAAVSDGIFSEINKALDTTSDKSVRIQNLDDAIGHYNKPATHAAVFDPNHIRSVNAAFDPEYKGPNILGSAAPVAIGAGSMLQSDESEAALTSKMLREALEAGIKDFRPPGGGSTMSGPLNTTQHDGIWAMLTGENPAAAVTPDAINKARTLELDPAFTGTGSAGAEMSRVMGGAPERVNFYQPEYIGQTEALKPEGVVGTPSRAVYQAQLDNVYDLETDPQNLRALAKGPTDLERMIKSAGYSGYSTKALSDPKAKRGVSVVMFEKTPVTTASGLMAAALSPGMSQAATTDTGSIEAAKIPLAQSAANVLDKVDLPVIGKAFPGLVDYLNHLAYADDPSMMRSFLAALDITP